MGAANTDKFIKAARKLAGNIDSSGIPSAIVDNFGLTSATGLPTDTAVEITVDRVDANGNKTPDKEEVIRGVVSGNSIINAVRGVEGTAQAHSSGAVWEVRLTADQWNRLIDAMIAGHNQDGTLRNICSLATASPAGAGTTTIYPTLAKITTVTMPAATQTLSVSGDVAGQFFIVEIINTTSQGALTWFSTIKWVDGIAPTLTGTNGKKDVFGFRVTSTGNYDGYVLGQNI